MNSVILQIAYKYISPLLLFIAVIALFRGHNYPGGGFIGGLLAGLAIVFRGFAFTPGEVIEGLKFQPQDLIAAGLFLVLMSFIPSMIKNEAVMTGAWWQLQITPEWILKLGTPLLFDAGIFLAVMGITVLFLFSLTKKN